MSEGVFQTDRAIFNNPIWKCPAKFRLFFLIYGNAVFLPEGVIKGNIYIGRGQFLRSYRNLAEDLEYFENRSLKKYSISYIKKLIDELVKEKRLELEDTELGTLFTVLNYEQYQGFERFEKGKNLGRGTNVQLENPQKMDEFTSAEVRTGIEQLKQFDFNGLGHVGSANQERRENGVRTLRERSENNNKNVKNVKKDKNVNTIGQSFYEIVKTYTSDTELQKAVNDYIQHRAEIKKTIKSERSMDLFLKKLSSLSESNADKIEILNSSIANGWQGIFPLKKDANKNNLKSNVPQHGNFTQREYSEEELEGLYENSVKREREVKK